MIQTECAHDDCRAPMIIPDDAIPKDHGAYSYTCPICRRPVDFGLVLKFLPITSCGGAREPTPQR